MAGTGLAEHDRAAASDGAGRVSAPQLALGTMLWLGAVAAVADGVDGARTLRIPRERPIPTAS